MRDLENERDAALAKIRDLENERDVALTKTRDLENEREAVNMQLRDLVNQRDATTDRFEERLRVLSSELLDTQIQLNSITKSLGWRVLSRYGRFKYRYLLPMYHRFGQTSSERTETLSPQDNSD